MADINLKVNLGGIQMQSPILAASGPFGNGHEYRDQVDMDAFGAIIVKGISAEPWPGNPTPRLAETASGMLNSVGLQNPGLKKFLSDHLPRLQDIGPRLIVNIVGCTVEEYALVAAGLNGAPGVDGLEINISCPNLKSGGLAFGTDPGATFSVVDAVRRQTSLPLIVKLSPNVTDIGVIATAAEDAGADALSLINTLSGMLIDVENRKPLLGNAFGGLSGPAIMPVALKMVWHTAEAVKIPVLGMGGITSARDALQFFMAGATAVAIGSGLFYDHNLAASIKKDLISYMAGQRCPSVESLIGLARGGEK